MRDTAGCPKSAGCPAFYAGRAKGGQAAWAKNMGPMGPIGLMWPMGCGWSPGKQRMEIMRSMGVQNEVQGCPK